MIRWLARLLPLVLTASLTACENESPAALDEAFVPVGPVTVEVHVPWSQFASDLRVLGGFGAADQVGLGFLANAYQGTLNAHTLLHVNAFPTQATVTDSIGTSRTDTSLEFVGGYLLLRFDAEASTNTQPVTISVGRTLTQWDAHTATWVNAADSASGSVPWPEPGGGPVAPLGSLVWNKAVADSILIPLDSAAVAAIGDTASDHGLRLAVDDPGNRLQITFAQLNLTTRPSVHRDTLITLVSDVITQTFIYDQRPAPVTSGFRVGGSPSYRSIFGLGLPASVSADAAACARVSCPLQLTADRITHAGLVLTTRAVEPAFRPTDSLAVQARTVVAPEALPKSPIGEALFLDNLGRVIGASVPFAGFAGTPRTVELAVTPLIQDLVRGKTADGSPPSRTVALLSLRCPPDLTTCRETRSLSYAAFAGPGEIGEPYLRLVLTVSGRLELP